MAVSTTFKQMCPSCEAMIPIKESMIGKKVECTKCKDRFIAERPDEDDEDDAPQVKPAAKKDTRLNGKKTSAPKKAGATAVTSKTPVPATKRPKLEVEEDDDEDDHKSNGKANGKPGKNKAQSNGKAAVKSRADEDDDDDDDEELDEADGKKKKKLKPGVGSNKLVLGLCLAVVGVIILVVAAIVVMNLGGGGGTQVKGNPMPRLNPPPEEQKKPENPGPAGPFVPPAPVAAPLDDAELVRLSNLLPNDCEHVFHAYFKNLLEKDNPLRAAFVARRGGVIEAGAGTLDDAELRRNLGFSVLAIDDMTCAERYTAPSWKYTVIHFKEIIKEDELKTALKLEAVQTEKGTLYRTAKPNPWLDQLARVEFGVPDHVRAADPRPANRGSYVRIHNAQTLIIGDDIPVKELVAKGQFAPKTIKQAPPPPVNPNPGGVGGNLGAGGAKGMIPPGGMKGKGMIPPGGMMGGTLPPPGGMMGGTLPMVPPGGMMGGSLRPPGAGNSGAAPTLPKVGMGSEDREITRFAYQQQPTPPGLGLGGSSGPKMGGAAGASGGPMPLGGAAGGPMPLGGGAGGTLTMPASGAAGAAGAVGAGGAGGAAGALGAGGGAGGGAPPPPPQLEMYMTINPDMKIILDRVEARKPDSKEKLLFSSVTDMSTNLVETSKEFAVRRPRQFWDVTLLLTEFKDRPRIRTLGTAFVQKDSARFQLRNEIGCADKAFAEDFEHEIMDRTAPQIVNFIKAMSGHKVELPTKEKPAVGPGPGPGPGPFGPGPGGMIAPGRGPGVGPIGPGSGSGPGSLKPPPGLGPIGPGTGPGQIGPGPIGPGPRPGPQQPSPEEEKKAQEATVSRITVHQDRASVDFRLDLVLDNRTLGFVQTVIALSASTLRSDMEAAADLSLRHTLARAGKLLGEQGLKEAGVSRGQFPPGSFKRDGGLITDREPRNRIGWMAGLLPYMGHQNLFNKIQFQQSWRDPDNWLAGNTTVPQFLDPMYPDNTRFVTVGDLPLDFAATHFVGIAGVGMDAASYKRGDPATAHKRGVFTYDESATLDEIRAGRGASNVILLIQVPHDGITGVSPWIAGGGATVRGVPEKNSIAPFILSKDKDGKTIQYQNRKGTYAVMADGSVRFIGQNISDEAFKAMATINGPSPPKFDVDKTPDTPLVPAPAKPKEVVKPADKQPAPIDKTPPVEKKTPTVRHQGEGRVYDKNASFSMVFPQGWKRMNNVGPAFMMAGGPAQGGVTPNLNVAWIPNDGSTIEKIAQDTKTAFPHVIKGWKTIDDAILTIDGKKTFAICGRCTAAGVEMQMLQYSIIGGNRKGYILTYTAAPASFSSLRKTFEQSAQSVQTD